MLPSTIEITWPSILANIYVTAHVYGSPHVYTPMTPLTLAWGWYTLLFLFLYDALREWAGGDPCRVAVSHVHLCINSTERQTIARDGLQHNYMLSKIPSFLFYYKLLEYLEAIAHSKQACFTPTLGRIMIFLPLFCQVLV